MSAPCPHGIPFYEQCTLCLEIQRRSMTDTEIHELRARVECAEARVRELLRDAQDMRARLDALHKVHDAIWALLGGNER